MQRRAHRIIALTTAAMLAGSVFCARPSAALAATYDELQQRVEEATSAYNDAMANVEKIQGQIDENEAKIAQIEGQLPEQRQRAADSLKTLYKMQQSSDGLIELLMSADNFNELVATIAYLDRIQSKNMTALDELAALNAELVEAKDTLNARKAQATQEADRAYQAQQDAIEAREEVVQQALAQAAAEQAQAEEALAQARKSAAEGKTFTNASGQQVAVSAPQTVTAPAEAVVTTKTDQSATPTQTPAAESTQQEQTQPMEQAPDQAQENSPAISERDAFVNEWAARIDNYLAGSPLGGHGRTFAEAAWDYGVDPRWSPAISCVESSMGLYCFKPFNAWGWGDSSWGDWDSAIRAHVSGLGRIYGYTNSTAAAQKYCPPTWKEWYSSVDAEMASI